METIFGLAKIPSLSKPRDRLRLPLGLFCFLQRGIGWRGQGPTLASCLIFGVHLTILIQSAEGI
jgi:hypothetical protein